MKRKIFLISSVLVLFVVLALLCVLSISNIPSDRALVRKNTFEGFNTEVDNVFIKDRLIRRLKITQIIGDVRPLLVMVHGAPGGISAFAKYTSDSLLRANFNMLVYDRPGYGSSDEIAEKSIREQAQILSQLIDNQFTKEGYVVFLSHSYGGAIAALTAEQLGKRCAGHVMVAPVIDDQSEPVFWFSNIPLSWPFKYVASQEMKTASVEKMSHQKALEKETRSWVKIKSPTIHFHGTEDWLAPPDNIEFVKEHFRKETLTSIVLEGRSHFILWNNEIYVKIKEALLTLKRL